MHRSCCRGCHRPCHAASAGTRRAGSGLSTPGGRGIPATDAAHPVAGPTNHTANHQ